jgi:hypothetical protein
VVTAIEILVGASIALVAISFVGVALGWARDRWLVVGTGILAGLSGVAAVVFVVGLATGTWDWQPLLVSLGGLVAATAAEAGALALSRGLRRISSVEEESAILLEQLGDALTAHSEARARELEQTLARERAETMHLLSEQERRLREERRIELERQNEEASVSLAELIAGNQRRVEQRLSAWSADLERAQQQLKARLEDLIRRQAEALQAHEARLEEHAAEVVALEEEQSAAMGRVRVELEGAVSESSEIAKSEIETHATERRRALHEVSERLRRREREMREQIEREEGEVRAQLAQMTGEVERRQIEQLERLLDRAVLRLSEDAERRFDAQLRDSREKTAERLSRELELSMETFTRSAEKEVAARISEAAQASAAKLQRQIDDVVRAAEVQTGISNERIQALSERLERSLDAANERLAEFEANVELELSAKLAEIERTLRAAG